MCERAYEQTFFAWIAVNHGANGGSGYRTEPMMKRTLSVLVSTTACTGLLVAGAVGLGPAAHAGENEPADRGGVTRADADSEAVSNGENGARGARKGHAPLKLQNEFDHIGAEVHSLTRDGRTSYYLDEGRPGDRAVVFISGQGTSLQAFQLTEFARTMREQLGLRVIAVERNGFGESEFDGSLGYDDYVDEVLGVLDHLDVDNFTVLAISGGGAYAAHLAERVPERVISLHAAAAVSRTLPTRSPLATCDESAEQRKESAARWTTDPKGWWTVSPTSPVMAVPGWQTAAFLDAARSFYLGGQMGAPDALAHENGLPCGPDAVVDASKITSPTYLYWGSQDESVPVSVMEEWKAALPNVAKATVYEGEDHTVQYRHWDQILADMAGYADRTVLCKDGQTQLVGDAAAKRDQEAGATLGMCAWATAGK